MQDLSYKAVAVRVFYLCLDNQLDSNSKLSIFPIPKLATILNSGFPFTYELMIDVSLFNAVKKAYISRAFYLNYQSLEKELYLPADEFDLNQYGYSNYSEYDDNFLGEIENTLRCPIDEKLRNELSEIKKICSNEEQKVQYLPISVAHLKRVVNQYRNIGYNWHLTEQQKELLQQYYNANEFLVECLNSDCYVSREVRQYIEDTLFLPMSEIEKYPKPNL